MSVVERLMKPGTFSVQLRTDYPWAVASAVADFDHIVITPTRLDPIGGYSDANILASAIYTGVITRKASPRTFEGAGLSYWLGTDAGRGKILETAITQTAATLSTWVSAILAAPSPLSVGTVTNTGLSSLTASHQWVTQRESLDAVCRALGAEWRANPAFTLDAAKSPDLFVSTPTVVVTRKEEGQDGSYRGLDGSLMVTSKDVQQYATRAVVISQGTGGTIATGAANGTTSYVDGLNNAVVMTQLVNGAADSSANAAAIAAAQVGQWNQERRELALTSKTYNVTRFVRPGDYVYVYDQLAELTDSSNQIPFRGELICPIKLRVYALTWPLERGMGVYARRSGATPTYTDLTDWIEWEDGGEVRWDVGAATRASNDTDAATAGATAYLGANGDIAARVYGVLPPRGYQAQFSLSGSDATLTNATLDTLYPGTETRDTDAFAVSGSATPVTIPTGKGGVYGLTVHVECSASGLGSDSYMQVVLGGSIARTFVSPGVSAQGTFDWAGTLRLAAADTVTVKCKHNFGSDKTITSNSYLSLERIGD